MTDDEIRSLVRAAVQRHLGASTSAQGASVDRPDAAVPPPPPLSISCGRYDLPRAEDDTLCLIEPAVQCNHCGYCQCHGH